MIGTLDAWLIRRLLTGATLNGEVEGIAKPFRPIADYLETLPQDARIVAWDGFLRARSDESELIEALAAVDPAGPMPAVEQPRFATIADLRYLQSEITWVWPGWIPAARVVGVAGFEGIGKTRLCLDLCRRAYHGLPWPDNQPPTFKPGTRSVWMCADAHHDELAEIMPAFKLPDDAVVFPAPPESPYDCTDLDSADTLDALEKVIAAVGPAFTFIDTLTAATSKDLCDARSIKPIKTPLARLTHEYNTCIVLSLHVSREGQALGRRIKAVTRSLMHLECPDPEHSSRLRLWVEKTFAKKPPALGVTMGDAGNTYDFDPPKAAEPNPGGRPPKKLPKAIGFLNQKLAKEDRKGCELVDEWEALGESKGTLFNAKKAMEKDGLLVVDDSVTPQIWHLIVD
jgi:hypothetical protein